jgi:hypothetical protein
MYKNNMNNTFTYQTQIIINGRWCGSLAWFDYNNDSSLDFLLTGSNGSIQITKLYKNNCDNTFAVQNQLNFTNVMDGSVTCGDYNNDGYLDILICGINLENGSSKKTIIYKNNGNETFTEMSDIEISDVYYGSAKWGDYNNDGLLDILLTGWNENSYFLSKIYKNNGNETFIEQTDITLIPVFYSDVAWGDYDNDNDLDILLTGYASISVTSKIYKNNISTPNTRPNVITGLQTIIEGNDVIFSWDEATDTNQPSAGLNYNIYVYSEDSPLNSTGQNDQSGQTGSTDGLYIASPQAFPYSHPLNGKRLLAEPGSIQGIRENGRVSYIIKGVFENCKKYYWSVQAIDATFAGGEFAPEQAFVFDNILPEITCPGNITINLSEGQTFYTVSGTELDHINTNDNCEIVSLTNNFNSLSTLAGEEIPIGTTTIFWSVTDIGGNSQTCNFDITVNEFVGISNISKEEVVIYPNPADGYVTINLAGFENLLELTIEIYDNSGKLVYSGKADCETTINTSNFKSGIYVVKIVMGREEFVSKKLIIE